MSMRYDFPKKLEIDIQSSQLIPNEIIMDKYIALAPINYDSEYESGDNYTKTANYTKFNSTVFLVSCVSDSSNDGHYLNYY